MPIVRPYRKIIYSTLFLFYIFSLNIVDKFDILLILVDNFLHFHSIFDDLLTTCG